MDIIWSCDSLTPNTQGKAYYYSPMTVNNCGVVDHIHTYLDSTFGAHLHTHVYHEGIGKKGENSVMSLMVKTLKDRKVLQENDIGGKL